MSEPAAQSVSVDLFAKVVKVLTKMYGERTCALPVFNKFLDALKTAEQLWQELPLAGKEGEK